MSFDLEWDHQFCLGCDKQTDGATYCSESCRLADYEKTSSTPSSGASSPALAGPSYPWTSSVPLATSTKFYLSPAYDFSNARPYSSSQPSQQQRTQSSTLAAAPRVLSPSSSHSSLTSVQSSTSTSSTEPAQLSQLSDKARRELRAYASSFEHVRLQRRRSY